LRQVGLPRVLYVGIVRLTRLLIAVLAGVLVLGAAALATASDRATSDRPDDLPLGTQQVHVMYVVPQDGTDRGLDTNGTLAASVASWQVWLKGQTGGKGLNLDTAGGQLDITFVRLPETDAAIAARGAFVRDEVEAQLHALGFTDPWKIYAVYYDGTSSFACGGASWPPALPGHVTALYLHGTPNCDQNPFARPGAPPGYLEFAMLHEILHALGSVPTCAPHQHRSGHTSDTPTDLMWAGDGAWTPSALDPGHDDYYGHGRPDCLDFASSGFLEGNLASALPGETLPPVPTATPASTATPTSTATPASTAGPAPMVVATTTPTPVPARLAPCTVPDVVYAKLATARKRLSRAGCRAGRITHRIARTRDQRRRVGRVVGQSPGPGRVLQPGARVRLVVVSRRR
jgi:hypothetical protein